MMASTNEDPTLLPASPLREPANIIRNIQEWRAMNLSPHEAHRRLVEAGYPIPIERVYQLFEQVPDTGYQIIDKKEARMHVASLMERLSVLIVAYMGKAMMDPKMVKPLSDMLQRLYEGVSFIHPANENDVSSIMQQQVGSDNYRVHIIEEIKSLQSGEEVD